MARAALLRYPCEAGKEPRGKIGQERGWLYYFSLKDCTGCSYRDKCLREGEKRQRVYLSEAEQERLLTGEAVTRREAKRIRLYVEPKYDGFVKSPTSALRCILRHCSVL